MESVEMYEKLFEDDNLDDLYELYCRVDKEVEAAKGRRMAVTFVGYFIACLCVFIAAAKPSGFRELLWSLVISALISSFLYIINFSVFGWMLGKNQNDNERRERIELRIKLAKKRQGQRWN